MPSHWLAYLRIDGAPWGLLGGADRAPLHIRLAHLGGENVAPAMAFDLDGDCEI